MMGGKRIGALKTADAELWGGGYYYEILSPARFSHEPERLREP